MKSIFFRMMLLSSWIVLSCTVLKAKSLWEFVDQAVDQHPQTALAKSNVDLQRSMATSLSLPDNPAIELYGNARRFAGGSSTVSSLTLRQKLPFWTARSRVQKVESERLQAVELDSKSVQQLTEREIVLAVFALARAQEEQTHLLDRRKRLNLVKLALSKTKAASEISKLERELIEAAILQTEDLFDAVELQARQIHLELEAVGLNQDAKIQARWLSPSRFEEFVAVFKNAAIKARPELEAKKSELKAAEYNLKATSPRPEFDLFVQIDDEQGGGFEQNSILGVSIQLPLNQIVGYPKQAASAEVLKAQAQLELANRKQELAVRSAQAEIQRAQTSLSRFKYSDIEVLERKVINAELQTRRGWLSITQLLELDRQLHTQIESVYDAQLRALTSIYSTCLTYECDQRRWIGAEL